ncbi:MAG: hypothetical protein OXG88_08100 [Gammaproteobacteria bacterium]|nr:hypothetical protein [Gammaproteobacteria bacterium]
MSKIANENPAYLIKVVKNIPRSDKFAVLLNDSDENIDPFRASIFLVKKLVILIFMNIVQASE